MGRLRRPFFSRTAQCHAKSPRRFLSAAPTRRNLRYRNNEGRTAPSAMSDVPSHDLPTRSDLMSDKIYKLIDLVGTSNNSTDEAIQNAITRASDTVRNLDWFQVVEPRGTIQDGKVTCYQVPLKVGFRLDLWLARAHVQRTSAEACAGRA